MTSLESKLNVKVIMLKSNGTFFYHGLKIENEKRIRKSVISLIFWGIKHNKKCIDFLEQTEQRLDNEENYTKN